MKFKIYRDCDAKALRKLVVELWKGSVLVDRRRMFSFPLFSLKKRLARKMARMQRMYEIIKE